MTSVRRLKIAGGLLALTAVITTSHLWGDSARQSPRKGQPRVRTYTPDKGDEGFTDDLADSKFAKGGLFTYRTTEGDLLFALSLKPKLEAGADRPTDYAIMVDTSASQARGPLANACGIAERLIATTHDQDRVSLWTVNTPAATASL